MTLARLVKFNPASQNAKRFLCDESKWLAEIDVMSNDAPRHHVELEMIAEQSSPD
jgi:hypothetical protein